MASPIRNSKNGLEVVALVMICFFSLITFLPSESVGIIHGHGDHHKIPETNAKQMKLVLGSRPPRCINKCMSCRPCMAVLVIPPHKKKKALINTTTPQDDETYYLLSWKCRCKNKLFQP
ncbi:hypothetical protein Ancab_006872 [Ancistrocladus abbreviatus]